MVAKVSIIIVLSLCIVAIQLIPIIKSWGRVPCQSIRDRANTLKSHQIKEVKIIYSRTQLELQLKKGNNYVPPTQLIVDDPQEIAEILEAFRKTTLWPGARPTDSPEDVHLIGDDFYFIPKDSNRKYFKISIVLSDAPYEQKDVEQSYGTEVARIYVKYAKRAFGQQQGTK